MMNEIIALLLPSLIGVKKYENLKGQELEQRSFIEKYLEYVLFVNLFSYAITMYIFKPIDIIFTASFTIKYIILSTIIAYVLPIIEKFMNKNLDISIKVGKNEKKD